MAALTADRNFYGHENVGQKRAYPVAASAVFYRGALVCIDADGFAIPASDTAGISSVIGVAVEGVDNSAGADGDVNVLVMRGERLFALTTGANAVTVTDRGRTVYVLDDQTVVKVAGVSNNIEAGECLDVKTVGGVVRVTIRAGTI